MLFLWVALLQIKDALLLSVSLVKNQMLAGKATPVFYNPTTPFSASMVFRLKLSTPVSFHEFSTLKPCLIGRPRSRRFYLGTFSCFGEKKMTEMNRISPLGVTRDAKNGGCMETEAILGDESSELQRNFWSSGLESTLNKASKWLVAAMFGSLILLKHDAEAIWAAAGAVLNSTLSISLKKTLNQRRPSSALRSDPGMPSSHAQSIFYASVFAVVSLIEWQGINALSLTAGAVVFLCGSYFSWLRVSQQLHTVSQVVVGAILGSICSILWFWSWHAFMLQAFVSVLWVRIVVVLGSAILCAGFLLYVIKHWIMDED